jgi:hypothetical protein
MGYPTTNTLDAAVMNVVTRTIEAYSGAVKITPSDSASLSAPVRGLVVSVAGDVKVVMVDNTVATIYLAAGIIHPLIVTKIYSTGTAATGIIGLY